LAFKRTIGIGFAERGAIPQEIGTDTCGTIGHLGAGVAVLCCPQFEALVRDARHARGTLGIVGAVLCANAFTIPDPDALKAFAVCGGFAFLSQLLVAFGITDAISSFADALHATGAARISPCGRIAFFAAHCGFGEHKTSSTRACGVIVAIITHSNVAADGGAMFIIRNALRLTDVLDVVTAEPLRA